MVWGQQRQGAAFAGSRAPLEDAIELIRVLIVDDSRVVAGSLADLLQDQSDIQVVGYAPSVHECIALAARLHPDVALIDFRLADGTGPDAAAGIRRVSARTRLLFVSRSESETVRTAAIDAGAAGFIPKSRIAIEVVGAVRKVAAGDVLFSPRELAGLAQRMRSQIDRTSLLLKLTSHELRNPLTLVRGYMAMLAEGVLTPEKIVDVAQLLQSRLDLMEQILAMAQIGHDSDNATNETFDVRDVVSEQLDYFRPVAAAHMLELQRQDEPVMVCANRASVGSIVRVLLDNAVKYSPAGGEIRCSVRRDDGQVFVAVRDSGVGIEAEHINDLFTRVGRLPTQENISIPGTGLGLYLSKEMAVRNGGDITVTSVPREGSEFTLRVPVNPPSTVAV